MEHWNQVIDIDSWELDETYDGVFPQGARDKTLYRSPRESVPSVIKPNHRYLFKKSNKNYPWQFWMEIIAYRMGQVMGVEVPPAYAAASTLEQLGRTVHGVLIEWFYGDSDIYFEGGNLMKEWIPNFDQKKGTQHNLGTILERTKGIPQMVEDAHRRAGGTFNDSAKESVPMAQELNYINYWAKVLTFDTVIGNTDRHQDNWGIVVPIGAKQDPDLLVRSLFRFDLMPHSPAFDNGTAMGHEILEQNFVKFDDFEYRHRYLTTPKKARHHMKWSLEDISPMNFYDFNHRMAVEYPETKAIMLERLEYSRTQLEEAFEGLIGLVDEKEHQLTEARVMFTIDLIMERTRLLRESLDTK